jgi:hypothetical protein
MEDINEKSTLHWKFTCYLVSTCWRKMHRRMTHWSSQGFISNLGEITEDHVRSAFISRSPRPELEEEIKGKDSALGHFVIEQSIEDVMNNPNVPSSTKTYLELPNLRAVFKAELEPEQAYNVDTCVEFHRLLINTLIGYGRALGMLKEVINAEMDEVNQSRGALLENHASEVYQWAVLLWRIAYSHMLLHHLKRLEADYRLTVPTHASFMIAKYSKFTSFNGDAEDVEYPDVELLTSSPTSLTSRSDSKALMFRNWIRLQVIHLASLSTLSTFSLGVEIHSRYDVNIRLFAVKPFQAPLMPCRTVIENLVPTTDREFDSECAITLIQEQIDIENKKIGDTTQATNIEDKETNDKGTEDKSNEKEIGNTSYDMNSTDFPLKSSICRALHSGTMSLGTVPSETGLAALVKFLHQANDPQDMEDIIQVQFCTLRKLNLFVDMSALYRIRIHA